MGLVLVTRHSKAQKMRKDYSEQSSTGLGRMRPWTRIGLESGVTVLAVIGQSRLPIFTKIK